MSEERVWTKWLTESDRRVFDSSGWGVRMGFGRSPVLLVVDVTYNFVGDRSQPILESMKTWRASCGEAGWRAVARVRELLDAAHDTGVPVVYSTGTQKHAGAVGPGRLADKNARNRAEAATFNRGNTIVAEVEPAAGDVVIPKTRPSAFFGTPLVAHLTDLGADSIIVCGGVTSGCVRASVLDAFSYGYRVAVAEEATFDRGEVTHAINLFDMNLKYADVVSVDTVISYLRTGRPEDHQMYTVGTGDGA